MSEGTNGSTGEDTLSGATGRYELPEEYSAFLGKFRERAEKIGWARSFVAGEWIFHAGEVPEECWLITEGRVAQFRGDTRISELGERRFLGMRAFHLRVPHTTSAQAIVPSVLVKIGGDFYEGLLTNPDFVRITIQQQEEEIQRVGEAATKYRAQLEATQREIFILQRSLDGYEKPAENVPRDVRASVTERILRLLYPDLRSADALATELMSALPAEMQQALRTQPKFGQLVALLTRNWNRVKSISFLRDK